jgi:Na+-translocating ferredoxin:NAD+ oxidoreductase RnfG subunit
MNPWIEKILYALIPMLLSGVVYLFSTVVALQSDVNVVKADAALARQALKEEIRNEVTENKLKIAVLQEQVKQLQNDK